MWWTMQSSLIWPFFSWSLLKSLKENSYPCFLSDNWQAKKTSVNMFLLLYLHWAPPQSRCCPPLSNPGQLVCTACHPTSQRQGQSPQQRPLFGQWPLSFHGEPTGTPQMRRDQGDALPDGDRGLKSNMRPLLLPLKPYMNYAEMWQTLMFGCIFIRVLLLCSLLMPSANSTSLYSRMHTLTPCSFRKRIKEKKNTIEQAV